MKAILTVGVSGSGKSTWATQQSRSGWRRNSNVRVINRDDARWEYSGRRGWNGDNAYHFNNRIEAHVTVRNHDKMVKASLEGTDIIISDTNLNSKTRNKLIRQCQELGYEVEIKEFPISFPEALRRDKGRGIYAVGEEVLKRQWEMWVTYHMEKLENE